MEKREASGADTETRNGKPESELETGDRTRAQLEAGNQKLRSERSKSKLRSETRNR